MIHLSYHTYVECPLPIDFMRPATRSSLPNRMMRHAYDGLKPLPASKKPPFAQYLPWKIPAKIVTFIEEFPCLFSQEGLVEIFNVSKTQSPILFRLTHLLPSNPMYFLLISTLVPLESSHSTHNLLTMMLSEFKT